MSHTSNNIIHDNYNIQIKLFQYLISIYKYNICTYPSKKEHISAKQKRDCNQNGNSLFLLLSYLPYFITVAVYLISIPLRQHCNYFFFTLNRGSCKTQNLNSCICKQSVFSPIASRLNFLSVLTAINFHYQHNFLIELIIN